MWPVLRDTDAGIPKKTCVPSVAPAARLRARLLPRGSHATADLTLSWLLQHDRYGARAAAVMAELEPDVQALSNPSYPPRTSSEVEFVRLAIGFPAAQTKFESSPLNRVPELDLGESVCSTGSPSPTADARDQPLPHAVPAAIGDDS